MEDTCSAAPAGGILVVGAIIMSTCSRRQASTRQGHDTVRVLTAALPPCRPQLPIATPTHLRGHPLQLATNNYAFRYANAPYHRRPTPSDSSPRFDSLQHYSPLPLTALGHMHSVTCLFPPSALKTLSLALAALSVARKLSACPHSPLGYTHGQVGPAVSSSNPTRISSQPPPAARLPHLYSPKPPGLPSLNTTPRPAGPRLSVARAPCLPVLPPIKAPASTRPTNLCHFSSTLHHPHIIHTSIPPCRLLALPIRPPSPSSTFFQTPLSCIKRRPICPSLPSLPSPPPPRPFVTLSATPVMLSATSTSRLSSLPLFLFMAPLIPGASVGAPNAWTSPLQRTTSIPALSAASSTGSRSNNSYAMSTR
jgi:hypothetical protein